MRLDQRLTLREKVFFVAALIGLLILFINMIWTPQGEVIKRRKKEINGVEQQAQAIEGLIETTKQQIAIEQSVPKEEVKIDEHTKKMLERKVVDPLAEIHSTVGLLSSRRVARGIKVDDIDIGEMVSQETYSVVPLSLHVRGRFGAIQGYIANLKKLNRPIVVKSFRLIREVGSAGMVDLSADMELFMPKR